MTLSTASLVGIVFALASACIVPTLAATPSFRSYTEATRRLARMEYMAAMAAPPLSCYVEHGFDYVGQDIANTPSPSADGCCGACYQTQGCRAFSWTNYNGGTCWLKSGRGAIVVNPNVHSALLLFGDNPVCALQQDTDYVGNDLARVSSASASGCCDLCHAYAGCRAYAWSNYLGGSCWLKSKGDQAVAKPGVVAAQAYPVDSSGSCVLETDTDFVDHDIGNAPSATAGGCCQICWNNPTCRAFAWTSQSGGTCWLKSMVGTRITKSGVIAARVRPDPPPCTTTPDVDFVDHDLANLLSHEASRCCDICRGYNGCTAYTWSDYQGGTCWLKSAKNETVSKTGVVSGVI